MEDLVISDLGADVLQFAAMGLGRFGLCAVHTGAYPGPIRYPGEADYLGEQRASLGLAGAESVTP